MARTADEDDPKHGNADPSSSLNNPAAAGGGGGNDTYYTQLRNHLTADGANARLERVEVNQRALIDKILARYASSYSIFRELLQNSNDACATMARIEIDTTSSNTTTTSLVTQVVYRNNGWVFREQDWKRLSKIAEGNPDVSKIGAFGVGAYTMFSITEEPVIVSGDRVLLFCWKGDSLYTQTTTTANGAMALGPKTNNKKSKEDETQWTSFVMPSREPYPVPDFTEFAEFLLSSLTFTESLKQITVHVNGKVKMEISKTILQPPRPMIASSTSTSAITSKSYFWNGWMTTGGSKNAFQKIPSPRSWLWLLEPMQESVVNFQVAMEHESHGIQMAHHSARYVLARLSTQSLDPRVRKSMERVTKKPPPDFVSLQIVLNNSTTASAAAMNPDPSTSNHKLSSATTTSTTSHPSSTLPETIAQSWATSTGRIFIGFKTSQTTGLAGCHVASSFIPTVEREAMDLQDPVIALYNTEILEMTGIILRSVLEHAMRELDIQFRIHVPEYQALEQKLLLEQKQQQQPSKPATTATTSSTTTTSSSVPTNEKNDPDDHVTSMTSSSSGLMSFARFMAKGVKKQIVSAAKLVESFVVTENQDPLLYPPDLRPLSTEERQAIALMQSFCPVPSTPDAKVGTAIARGFASVSSSVPVLTRTGVVDSREAKLSHLGIENFVYENVIRRVVYENAREYHTVIASHCRKLNFEDDLMNFVSNTVLELRQLVQLIQWWTKFSKLDAPHLAATRGSRLKDAIRFRTKDSDGNDVIRRLGDWIFYVEKNSSFSDGVPLPESVLSAELQDSIGYAVLTDEVLQDTWFSPLPMEIWVEFISHHKALNDGQPEDELLRVKILTILSQEFMRRSNTTGERGVFGGFCQALLAEKRCIPFDSDQPTQYAAEKPSDLYLDSAELKAFDGVAGSTFHKVSSSLSSAGVTETFLLALGVRKSVSIEFLFANLETFSWSQDPKPLVEYLRKATLTAKDVNKLSATRYLPAVVHDGDHSKRSLCAPGELYLPNEDLRIFSFLKVLHWPAETMLSEKSENGKFLVKLGMKTMPHLTTILTHLANDHLNDKEREQCLDFVCDRLVPHGCFYAQYNALSFGDKRRFRIIPCVVSSPHASFPQSTTSSQRQSPVACFTDETCGVMGFPVIDPKLGKKAKLYGSLFQCDTEPKANYLLNQLAHLVALAKNSPSPDVNVENTFSKIFEYLSRRITDLQYRDSLLPLKREAFIPCNIGGDIVWCKPNDVFFKRANRKEESLTEDLFHGIPFSPFLAAVGVKEEATTKDLFQKIIESPENVLRKLGSEKKYRALLRRIAADLPFPPSNPPKQVRESPFLLAYTIKHPSSETKEVVNEDQMTYHLAKAADVYIIDNSNYGRIFPVSRAPPESDLEDFYHMLGSQFISKAVERRFEVVGQPSSNTELALAFKERLRERGPLLVSPSVTSRPLVNGAAALLDESRLEFFETTNILAVYTLGKNSRRNRVTCCSRELSRKKNAIYLVGDLDMFDAGMAIGSLILKRCQLEDAFFISSLLEAPLDQLKSRGFPVDRILHPIAPDPPSPVATKRVNELNTPVIAEIPSALDHSATRATEENSAFNDSNVSSKADILKQMFPDASKSFIEAALGPNPSMEKVRDLAERMATGQQTYPTEVNAPSSGNLSTTSTLPASHVDSDNSPPTKKKSGLRQRFGRALTGKRGTGGSSSMAYNTTQVSVGNGAATSTEHRYPVSPAIDANTQSSLEKMLEHSVQTATQVQRDRIESPEATLTSIPQELDRGETCEVLPGHSLKPFLGPRGHGKTRNGIQVFSATRHASSEQFLTENDASLELFANVLDLLCTGVFGLKLDSVAIYHDPAGASIAFNSNRSLFFNFRFFHALHFLQNKHNSSECYSYWFVTICHELSHNFVSGHTKEHGFYTESYSSHYLPKLMGMLKSSNIV